MTRLTRTVIDSGALMHNLECARRAAPGCSVMAVIKADAYGHGLLNAARALEQADAYAVNSVDEALLLDTLPRRRAVVILQGFFTSQELSIIVERGFVPVIHHARQLELIEACTAPRRRIMVWLKLDTGMHRLGIPAEQAAAVRRRLRACAAVGEIGWMSHLACADEAGSEQTRRQLICFDEATAGFDGPRSIANSAALFNLPVSHHQWVRPGIALYGVSPYAEGNGGLLGLRPAMTVETQIISVQRLRRGDRVGYGGSWLCPEDMPIGIAAAGYAEGYPRHAGAGAYVLVDGRRAPLIGRVSMDMVCVELRDFSPLPAVGARVELWGRALAVEDIARACSTIPYELLCRAGAGNRR